MRIISGIRKGKKIITPKKTLIRPTTDRTKEFMFDYIGTSIMHSKVLDMFAGTGNLGIEALSRKADNAVFIEKNRANSLIIQKNLQLSQLESQAHVITTDAFKYLKWLREREIRFHFVFADPPYQRNLYLRLLHEIDTSSILEKDGMLIFEHQSSEITKIDLAFLKMIKVKVFGNTSISFYIKNGG